MSYSASRSRFLNFGLMSNPAIKFAPSDAHNLEWPETVQHLIQARQTVLPKRLVAPGPDVLQQRDLFSAASAAPDHGQIQPWRLVIVPTEQRSRLADVFARALLDRDADATPDEVSQAREKAFRAPLLMLLVVDGDKGDQSIDIHERVLAAGCAVQNMMLLATAMGFGSALTSGKALKSKALRDCFGLASGEVAPCFISMGTVTQRKGFKSRSEPSTFVSTLGALHTAHH